MSVACTVSMVAEEARKVLAEVHRTNSKHACGQGENGQQEPLTRITREGLC